MHETSSLVVDPEVEGDCCRKKNSNAMASARGKAPDKNHFWTEEETKLMLIQLKELNILKYIDGRRTRNGHLFKKVAEKMQDAGCKRTAEQVRVRWKHLKQNYSNAKRQTQAGGHNRVSSPFSDQLEELLGRRPLLRTEEDDVDVGSSPSSPESVLRIEGLEDSEVEESRTPQHPSTTSTPSQDVPGTTTTNPLRRRHSAQNMDALFQMLEEMNNSWRQQLRDREEREERLVQRIIDSNASVVAALLECIQSLRPPTQPRPTVPPHPLTEHIKDEE